MFRRFLALVFLVLGAVSPAAGAPPELHERRGARPAPVMLDVQIARAMEREGCVPAGTKGAWIYNVRMHRAQDWNPVPGAALQDCMNRVLPSFPAAITGAVLLWPPRAH